jgi:tetratricopeptide (TPR) repeat protein
MKRVSGKRKIALAYPLRHVAGPPTMSAVPHRAVFLSYASQDASAARRICDALLAAGVEVWFDQSELRGGDAWDAKIRKQIKECALFVPIISENTQSRPEGYFRLEWHLAEQRSHLIARERPFIVPLAIDDTRDDDALVPDAFVAVQWMRVPGGEPTPAFSDRVKALLAATDAARDRHVGSKTESEAHGDPVLQPKHRVDAAPRLPRWVRPVLAGAVLAAVALAIALVKSKSGNTTQPGAVKAPDVPVVTEKLSPARELTERARLMLDKGHLTREQLDTAGELCERALQLDPTDALVWAQAARVDLLLIFPYAYDTSAARRKQAQERATRALNLAPDELAVRVVHAAALAHAVGTPALIAEAEKTFRELAANHPDDQELVRQLAEVLREEHRFDEAARLFEGIGEFEVAGWSYFEGGDMRAALATVRRAPRSVTALQLTALVEYCGIEDLVAAQATIDQMHPSELLAETVAAEAMRVALYRRDSARVLEIGRGLSRDYIDGNGFRGPRAYFTGLAHQIAGRSEQAAVEWRKALGVVESMMKTAPDDRSLLISSAWLHAALNDLTAAETNFAQSQGLAGLTGDALDFANYGVLLRLRKKEAVLTGVEHYFQTRRPLWQVMHSDLRFSPEADFLRGDPRFEKLLRDYLPAGAKPL